MVKNIIVYQWLDVVITFICCANLIKKNRRNGRRTYICTLVCQKIKLCKNDERYKNYFLISAKTLGTILSRFHKFSFRNIEFEYIYVYNILKMYVCNMYRKSQCLPELL